MKTIISQTSQELGQKAAAHSAQVINEAIANKGYANIILSTGASQFDTLSALIGQSIDWSRVTVFHLDEYLGMSIDHKASFRRYLNERFVSKINLGEFVPVNGEGDKDQAIASLCKRIEGVEIDLALIGIGENAHIAFNDPPADFDTEQPYIIVKLDLDCRKQQLGEGWFATIDDVPTHAISMSVKQILKSKVIISSVPYAVKANAVCKTINTDTLDPMVPATALKNHADWSLYLDSDSAAKL